MNWPTFNVGDRVRFTDHFRKVCGVSPFTLQHGTVAIDFVFDIDDENPTKDDWQKRPEYTPVIWDGNTEPHAIHSSNLTLIERTISVSSIPLTEQK